MINVTIEREGYKIEAEVSTRGASPGEYPALMVDDITKAWIHDEQAFREEYGNKTLEDVMADEAGTIDDLLIDAAQLEINSERDDRDYDPFEHVGGW